MAGVDADADAMVTRQRTAGQQASRWQQTLESRSLLAMQPCGRWGTRWSTEHGLTKPMLHGGLVRDAPRCIPTPGPLSEDLQDLSWARSPFASRLPLPLGGCGDRTGAAHRQGCPVADHTGAPIQSNLQAVLGSANGTVGDAVWQGVCRSVGLSVTADCHTAW